MPTIDGKRLLADLRRLAEFGRWQTGVHRPAFSGEDMDSRRWLAQRLAEAGLEPEIDGVGNVIGRSRAPGPKLLIGSHTDTQPHGGWLDGAMGVIYGLELARAFASDPGCRRVGIEVASWSDEEGQYSDLLGSRSFCDLVSDADLDRIQHRDSETPLRDVLARVGLDKKPRARLDAARYIGYLEAHIEQGPELEDQGKRLGIVTSIVGNCNFILTFAGVQNHAGTTRMAIRKDAGVALVRLAAAIDRRFPKVAGPRSVWTTGNVMFDPGAKSIIPGRAEMWFQFRDTDPGYLAAMERLLTELGEEVNRGPCAVTLTKRSQTAPQAMDPWFQTVLERAAERHASGMHIRMPSGAGHDAQIVAKRIPAGMLFVPSIGGISHHHTENTRDEDLVLGCQVLATAAFDLLLDAQKAA